MLLVNTILRFSANGGESRTFGNQTINVPPQGGFYDKSIAFTDGTGLGKAQKWAHVPINLAAGASVTVDLTAVAGGLFAEVDYSNIKGLIISNDNAEQEVDTVTITGSPDGGTFTITVAGQTTSALVYNAASSAVQTAVRALSTVGGTLATVTGDAGGPYTIIFDTLLGAMTVSASGTSLTGGSTPAATAARVPCDLHIGDDGTGSNVWSAPFVGTNVRLVVQPGESLMKATTTKAGYAVDGTNKSLLIENVGSVAIIGVLLLLGEGS